MDMESLIGTTPTAKNPAIQFQNFHHPVASASDFAGQAAWLDNRYKYVVTKQGNEELFDISADPLEKNNLAAEHPRIAKRMKKEMQEWQASVEQSLGGADYH